MRVGQTVLFAGGTYQDEKTGRPVRRLTPPSFRSHHQYFYLNMWTPDSKRVLISSNREDGCYRHYLVEIETGEAVCLTDAEELGHHFGELAHDGSHFLYVTGPELRRRSLADLTEETVYVQPEPWTGRSVYYGATASHARAVMVEMHRDDVVPAKTGWDAFPKQFEARPRCRLVELDLASGEARVIHEDRCWLGHPNYRPDGRTIMFCHEGPWDRVDSRIWFVDPDGSNLREGRRRERAPGELAERWGHEYWLADSSHAAYVYFPERYGVDGTLRFLDPETLTEEVVMPVPPCSHFLSNRENTHVVCDGEAGLSDDLYLLDLATKTSAELCRHGSSMKPYIDPRTGRANTQEAHPHPCFSPDGRRVVFTSDREGEPAVYVVEM